MLEIRLVRLPTLALRLIEAFMLVALTVFVGRGATEMSRSATEPRAIILAAVVGTVGVLMVFLSLPAVTEGVYWVFTMIRFRGAFIVIRTWDREAGHRHRLMAWRDVEGGFMQCLAGFGDQPAR
jgi:hypothetical protein